MTRHIAITLAAALVAGACASGTRVESAGEIAPATPMNGAVLPSGTTMRVRLNESVGTRSSHEGDQFSATVTEAVRASNGVDAVPVGSMLFGHVTGLHSANLPGEQSVIRLAFDSVRIRGTSYPFDGQIADVKVSSEQTDPTKASVAKEAGVGAIAGAALGAIIGGAELSKIITGGLLGAAAGTVISLGTGSTQSVIPEGTRMTVRSMDTVRLR
ncbi:MAG TPA: hypothetical protein VGQ44_22120 [Gemmatimonadaceae bacterium]|jgi:hypothetical protein|nr:hypothetical protein [Gemmatimonadaceae bacterium]